MSRRVTLLVAAAVTAVCAGIAGIGLSRIHDHSSPGLKLEQGVPAEASVSQLRSYAASRRRAVYWAGSLPSRRLELTETSRGTFVRYLPEEAGVGDKRSLYLTVATYPMPRAFAFARKAARRQGAVSRALRDGIAVWQAERPTSVYFAHTGSSQLIEVFDPNSRRARGLVLSGRVRPVPDV